MKLSGLPVPSGRSGLYNRSAAFVASTVRKSSFSGPQAQLRSVPPFQNEGTTGEDSARRKRINLTAWSKLCCGCTKFVLLAFLSVTKNESHQDRDMNPTGNEIPISPETRNHDRCRWGFYCFRVSTHITRRRQFHQHSVVSKKKAYKIGHRRA